MATRAGPAIDGRRGRGSPGPGAPGHRWLGRSGPSRSSAAVAVTVGITVGIAIGILPGALAPGFPASASPVPQVALRSATIAPVHPPAPQDFTAGARAGTAAALSTVTCTSNSNCIAVGSSGAILLSDDGGIAWSTETAVTAELLWGVTCPDATECVAVGGEGTILLSDDGGASWRSVPSGTTVMLWSVSCPSASRCVAVGDGGTILISDDSGSTWTPGSSGTADDLTSVSCPAVEECVVVGNDVDVLVTENGGTTWSAYPTTSTGSFASIDCTSTLDCLAVGDSGLVALTSDGGVSWSVYPSATGEALWGVTCVPGAFCIAVGSAGSIVSSDPAASGLRPSGTTQDLHGISCPSVAECVAVGASGTILTTGDSGANWVLRNQSLASLPPVKALFLGGSVSLTLGFGLATVSGEYGVDITDDAILGCGVVDGEPIIVQGVTYYDEATPCNGQPGVEQWPQYYAQDVAATLPNVAVLLIGRWETVDRMWEGHWSHADQPAYDAYISSQLTTAVEIMASHGAKVVLLTSPYFDEQPPPASGGIWPEDRRARVDAVNRIIYQVASQFPSTVTVINLNARMDPGGQFASFIDGVGIRTSDGVHITVAGGQWLAPWLLPQIYDIATSAPGPQSTWELAANGSVRGFGDAPYLGSPSTQGRGPASAGAVVAMAATPDGGGYWLAGAGGRVYAFGDARFYGSMAGRGLPSPIVAMAASGGGNGYWLAAADGTVYPFGEVPFDGAMGSPSPSGPVVGIARA